MKLFTSTWRFYLSILFFFGAVSAILQLDFSTFLSGIFLGIIFILPEILYFIKPAPEIWARWNASASSQKQQIRMERARNGELTPKWVDVTGKCACFVGSENNKKYRTTLKKCSCPDFAKRGVPCKHMYYLADCCNLLNQTDVNENKSSI